MSNSPASKQRDGLRSPSPSALVGVTVGCVLVGTPQGRRVLRRGASTLASAAGFVVNTLQDLTTYHPHKLPQWETAIKSMDSFLTKSGVSDELTKSVSHRLLDNLGFLVRVQEQMSSSRDVEIEANHSYDLPTKQEAANYMRFATAVYGYSMIRSVSLEMNAKEAPLGTQEEEIMRHTGIISKDDILVSDVEHGTGLECLRHMIAVNHEDKTVVFAVRGTFDLSGVVVDLVGYSEPFCGGEAHSGMARMARAVWQQAEKALGDKIESLNEDYELVITGHSLGAGVACLMTIMVYHEKLLKQHVKVRCLAYAPPPVFYPLSAAHEAMPHITAYVHDNDVVPSLSVSSFRRLFAQVAVFDKEFRDESWINMIRMRRGSKEIPNHIVNDVIETRDKHDKLLPKVEGAPMLAIPANVIVWLRAHEPESFANDTDASFSTVLCDATKYAEYGIRLNSNMIHDHFPSKYQGALENVLAQEREIIERKEQ